MPRKSKKNVKSTTSITTDTPEIILRKLDNKEKDIRAILLMIRSIDSIGSFSGVNLLIDNYTTIANLANQMTRFGPTCIRNKYALCWKEIYHIQIVLENKPVHLANIIQKISLDLPALKNQLLFILKDEIEFITNRFKQIEINQINDLISAAPSSLGDKLVNIEKTILSEYSALIVTRIRSEVQVSPDAIDFIDRANRYYLARKFTIIGELLKELPRAGEFSSLVSSSQVVSDVRDSLIHNHQQLLSIDLISANKLKIYTQNLFVALVEVTSSNVVNKGLEQTLSTIATLRNNSTSLLFELNKLEKQEKPNEVVVSNRNEQDKLNKLIAIANSKLNGKPVSHTWEQLNEEYLALLNNVSSELKKIYPIALNEYQKMDIQETNQKIKDDKETQKIKDDEIKKTATLDKARNKFVDRLFQITDEYTFLQTIEASNILEGLKDYIRQHATNIIAENMEKIRDEKEETIVQDFNEISSSTLKSAQSKGIYLRKNGLSHDMFSFNSQKFDQILFDNIIPAKDDINSVYYILSNKESEAASAKIMNNIGVSYIRLGLYPQAVEILLKAQEYVKNNPLKIQKEKMKDFGFTNTDHIRFYDFDEMFIGIESYGYEIISNLAEAYLLNGKIDQSIALIEEVLSKVNLEDIESFSKDFRNSLASTVNSLATFYDSKNIGSALYLFEQAYKLALAEDALFIVGGNFIKYLEKIGNHTKATEIRDDLNCKANVYIEFVSKIDNSAQLIAQEDLIRAKILIDECEIFLEANEGKLRVLKGDRVALLVFEVIRTRLDLSAKEPEYLDSKLKEIEVNFREKYNALEPNLQQSSDINNTYLFLSNAYATLAHALTKKDINRALIALNKAEEYFVLGEGKPLTTRNTTTSSRILAEAYSEYSTHSGDKGYFNKAIALHSKYKTNSEVTYHNWGTTNLTLAEKAYATGRIQSAIPKYLEAIPALIKAGNTSTETLRALGMCYEGLGDCTHNKIYLKKASATYDKCLAQIPKSNADFKEVKEFRENCKRKTCALDTTSVTSFASLVRSEKAPFSTIKLNAVEKKVLHGFKQMKGTEYSLKIKGIESHDLEAFCKERLNRNDIEIKRLPTGGCYFKIDSNIVAALNLIKETKKSLSV